jgi:hypothetical protein
MLIWPFLALTGILMSLLAYAVFSIEKNTIIRNWDKRRCDLPVMFGASYFKPSADSRTDTEFAQDNFSFCMKRRVTEIMETLMVPFMLIFKGQMGVTGSIGSGLNIVQNIFSQIYQAFLSFLRPFYERYVAVAYQVMAITQHLKMAYQKINTIVLAFIYTGLTILRGMINVKDFIIKVVLIILGILVALVIILFFALAPFIGIIILPTITAIAAAGGGGAVGGMADAFCLAPETRIRMADGTMKKVCDVVVGDSVAEGGVVQAVIETTGQGVDLWSIGSGGGGGGADGQNLISSYHIVWDDVRNTWCFAKDHSRSLASPEKRDRLWCLVTEKRVFELPGGILVRDWEELCDSDSEGNDAYEHLVARLLNGLGDGTLVPDAIKLGKYFYKVNGRLVNILGQEQIAQIGDTIQTSLTESGTSPYSKIVGFSTFLCESLWCKDIYGDKFYNTKILLNKEIRLPMTENGQILLFSKSGEPQKIIMDFTEVGSHQLNKTYDFILSRLNSHTVAH